MICLEEWHFTIDLLGKSKVTSLVTATGAMFSLECDIHKRLFHQLSKNFTFAV
tara:strand:+ start:280 stop:438 length:159 start_codon:yes stop_codon:yes gene_type:complete